nr:reverse transcriptase domain-containing protein [Tanacetum cinerariifolium]
MATNGNGGDVPPPGGGDLPVPDLRMMEELCQPTLNGRGGPIALIAIQATNFGLKNDMIQQVELAVYGVRLSYESDGFVLRIAKVELAVYGVRLSYESDGFVLRCMGRGDMDG